MAIITKFYNDLVPGNEVDVQQGNYSVNWCPVRITLDKKNCHVYMPSMSSATYTEKIKSALKALTETATKEKSFNSLFVNIRDAVTFGDVASVIPNNFVMDHIEMDSEGNFSIVSHIGTRVQLQSKL